uniref:Toll-like recrptor 5m n=1 Tax=Argyrosomus japonicus TaxID=448029 RepID=A0A7M1XYI4_ARGJA|nr:toll-like recrptor 5m [Argyrosomus japonicus]
MLSCQGGQRAAGGVVGAGMQGERSCDCSENQLFLSMRSTYTAACGQKHHYWVPALPFNITHLYLEMNYISEINRTSLKDYDQLIELDLGMQYSRILVIRNNAFLRQRKLTRLVLGSNINLQLESRAFAGLYNLQNLFLDYCNFTDSILSGGFLQPLLSLEMLDLFGNNIVRLRPGLFFSKLTKFTKLNLKLNQIQTLCEEDLVGFRGKYFTLLNLNSNDLYLEDDWQRCGNPFREMAFDTLDLSSSGFSLNKSQQFFKAIEGTPIAHLIFSGYIGKGFSHKNLPDPDESTFEGLVNSAVNHLDLSKNMIFALQRAVFSPLKDAIIIDISQNKINQIHKNAFSGLQGHLRLLNLSSNLIGEIYSHTFTDLTDLRVLDLSNNHIGALGYKAFSGLPNLRGLFLTGNSLRDLGSPESLPNLDLLLLADNKLKSIAASPDPLTFSSLSFLSLAVNRFHCDCHLESFLKWLNVTNLTFLSPLEEYKCEFPAALHNLPLLNYSTIIEPCEEDDEKAVHELKSYLFILSALLIITAVLSGIVYARLRGHIFIIYKKIIGRVLEGPKPMPPVDEVQYDVFLCFSDNDYGWVEAALLKKLDNQFSEENIFRCCFEARDFLPGEDHLSNIRDAIWGNGWCLEAFTLAQGRMLEELTNVLIMLVVGKLMKYNAVRAFVQRREYLVWPEDPQDMEWYLERLVSQILKDTKVKKIAEDNPEPAQSDIHPQEEDGIELDNIGAIAI